MSTFLDTLLWTLLENEIIPIVISISFQVTIFSYITRLITENLQNCLLVAFSASCPLRFSFHHFKSNNFLWSLSVCLISSTNSHNFKLFSYLSFLFDDSKALAKNLHSSSSTRCSKRLIFCFVSQLLLCVPHSRLFICAVTCLASCRITVNN